MKSLLDPSWSRLGAVLGSSWGPLGVLLGPPGGLLAPLEVLLGPLGAFLESPWGDLGRLETIFREVGKTYKNTWFLQVLGAPRGSKMGPSWAKLALRCDLESSYSHLDAFEDVLSSSSRRLVVFMSSSSRLGAVLAPTCASL